MASLTGTGALIRFILRRDRVRLPVWILAIVGTVLLVAVILIQMFPTAEDRQSRAEVIDSPAAAAASGPGHGLENYTFGAMLANEMLSFMAIFAALMSLFLVVRHTRAEEESGRAELVRAAVVGRYAATAATLVVVCSAHLMIAALLAASLPLLHEHFTVVGSAAFAVSLASVGLVFVGVGIAAAQLSEHGRSALGFGIATLGVAYTLRAIGDVGLGPLSWLSPIGWAQATRSYVDERWWPLLLSLGLTVALVTIGLLLSARRDVGAGLVQTRPGPAEASNALAHPLGLALRLQRGMLLAWGAGLLLLGLVYGSIMNEVEEYARENEALQELLLREGGATFTDSFTAIVVLFLALVAAAFAVYSTLRLPDEESAGRAELILATAVPRWQWIASHLAVAMAGGAIILVVGVVGMGAVAAVVTGDASWMPRLLGAGLVHVPALWLMAGLALALYGLAPRLTALAWLVLVYGLVEGLFGGMLNLPDWLADLSPFRHVPQLPAADFAAAPVTVLTALAAALIVAGVIGFRRRDVAVT